MNVNSSYSRIPNLSSRTGGKVALHWHTVTALVLLQATCLSTQITNLWSFFLGGGWYLCLLVPHCWFHASVSHLSDGDCCLVLPVFSPYIAAQKPALPSIKRCLMARGYRLWLLSEKYHYIICLSIAFGRPINEEPGL